MWDSLQLFMIMYDFVWLWLTLNDFIGISSYYIEYLWLCDSIWLYLTLFDSVWLYLNLSWSVWLYLAWLDLDCLCLTLCLTFNLLDSSWLNLFSFVSICLNLLNFVRSVEKSGEHGRTLPKHLRFSPGTHKERSYQLSVKIALFINIVKLVSLLVPVA